MDVGNRRLFLVAALSGRRGLRKALLNGWWSTQKDADRATALSLILGITGVRFQAPAADDPFQQLLREDLVPFLTGLSHAFALGTVESIGYWSAELCMNLGDGI